MPDTFQEQMRYEYPLSTDSFVVDVGGYEGKFARQLHQIYGCSIDVYEPIPQFFRQCQETCRIYPIIRVFNKGLGGNSRKEILSIETDRTGLFAKGERIEVEIVDAMSIFREKTIDLLKINIEGMEYELLERIVPNNIKNIQVQFHKIGENYEERYQKIREKLLQTHELTYDFPFVWQNFKLK